MEIYYKSFGGCFNYLKIDLLFPLCRKTVGIDQIDDAPNYKYELSLNSGFTYFKALHFRSFRLAFLGFGFSVIRQTGY